MYRNVNRPVTIDNPRPHERVKSNDTGDIHADGYRVEKRRPRSRHQLESVDVEEGNIWEF